MVNPLRRNKRRKAESKHGFGEAIFFVGDLLQQIEMPLFTITTHQEHFANDTAVTLLVDVNVELAFLFVWGPDEKIDTSITGYLVGRNFEPSFGMVKLQRLGNVFNGFVRTAHVREFPQRKHQSPVLQRLAKWNVLVDDFRFIDQHVINIAKLKSRCALRDVRVRRR